MEAARTDFFDLSGASPWQTRSSEVIYENGFLRLREDVVVQPDGQLGRYAYLDVPRPIVVVVPVTDDGQVYLVRQWRYVWRRNSWEVPAGSCELGEEPLHGAQRELAEEVGLNATTWESLGQGRGSAALSSMYHLFLARGLSPTADGPMTEGAERDLTAHRVPFTLAVEAAFDGRIAHAVSAVALLRAARRLGCAQVLALTWRGGSDLQSRASTQP